MKYPIILGILFGLLLIHFPLSGQIITIPTDYVTIQEGINAANEGDTVIALPGTYFEKINYNGKNIVVGSLFITTHDTSYISKTIINGNNNMGRLVTFANGETESAKLIGLTIKNGYGDYISQVTIGVGIYILNSSPTIKNNIITDNSCDSYIYGCGIALQNSSAKILNNIIKNNHRAYNGGGIFISKSEGIVIENNIISGNETYSGYGEALGAGIFISRSNNILIKKNLIYNNVVDFGDGGGIYIGKSSVIIINNTIVHNSIYVHNGSGTAIYISDSSDVQIRNTIFWANNPQNFVEIYGGSPIVTYCNTQNGYPGTGNISCYPLFNDPANGNFNLTSQSPCINAGDPNSDLDADGTIADLGFQYFDMSNYGTIKGKVSLSGGYGNIKSVKIDCGEFITNPDKNGNYLFNLLPGSYHLTAFLPGYQNDNLNNINVSPGQVTSNVNLILNYSYSNKTIYVAQDSSGDFTSIQEGINAAIDGDTILVHPGTYNENVDFTGKNIVLGSLFLITQDTSYNSQTIINGSGIGHTIKVEGNTDDYSQICGFTLENSNNNYYCIYCYNASLRINHNILSNHNCPMGTGIYIRYSSLIIIENNKIINNKNNGLIVYNTDIVLVTENVFNNNSIGISSNTSGSIITNNIFSNGTYGVTGHNYGTKIINNYFSNNIYSIECSGFSPLIENNIILNSTDGIYCSGGFPVIVNNLIGNSINDGILCLSSSSVIINNTIVNNSGVGIYCNLCSSSIVNNIIWGNGASFSINVSSNVTISYCNIEGEFPANAIDSGGNIYENPQFEEPENYQLASNSPCIDAGIPDTTGLGLHALDIVGSYRIWDGDGDNISIIDIGAYEFTNNHVPTSILISNSSISEFSPVGSTIGIFSTTDPDENDMHTYQLIPGNGINDSDNAEFLIEGNTLKTNAELNFETQPACHIYVRSDDGHGGTLAQSFIIQVTYTRIEKANHNFVKIYPNPNNGIVLLQNVLNSKIQFYDLSGKLLLTDFSNTTIKNLNLSKFSNGNYILRIINKTGVFNRHIIIFK